MMVGTRRNASRASKRGASSNAPSVYSELLVEAGVSSHASNDGERPLKRPRVGKPPDKLATAHTTATPKLDQGQNLKDGKIAAGKEESSDEEDEDIEFQDVALPEPTVQTMERNSDDEDESEDEEQEFEDVDFTAPLPNTETTQPKQAELELNLTAQKAAASASRPQERRKPLTRDEKDRRANIHKLHLLCLLSHVAKRNHWCNDATVQEALRPHLVDKTVGYLTPGAHLPQFGRSESLKTGLKEAETVWRTKYEVTERGMRRALWAEDVTYLQEYELPDDIESCHDRQEFRDAAQKLQGSRDVGAQLYCALLRSVGVRARLVCSLQPLAFNSAGPMLPKPRAKKNPPKPLSRTEKMRASMAQWKERSEAEFKALSPAGPSSRRRLGHPNAASYNFTPIASPPKSRPQFAAPEKIHESNHPVYWVEILDVGHQKWQPVDPLVTHSFWKPKVFEPPIHDRENLMSYVIAFEADGTAKDVTKRYTKAYTAKTRRLRVDGIVEDGEKWWRGTMKMFKGKSRGDLEQIENSELAGAEAREPMPKSVQDFKDHPIYALERHLRRNEVLLPDAMPSGTVAASSRGPLERIYRRRNVRVGRSPDKWFRMGREVKPNEIPVKWLPKKSRPQNRLDDEEEENAEDPGMPIYTIEQTELYEPPPVRKGIVPKNKFGNIEIYVQSMVPRGGTYITHPHATRAAYVLGIDYAPALTGFSFSGKHGTAVLHGIVIPSEQSEAVHATIASLEELEIEEVAEQKRMTVWRVWRRLLKGLRIRERIWSDVGEDEKREAEEVALRRVKERMNDDGDEVEEESEEEMDDGIESDATEEFDMVVDNDDDMGGGFMVE